MDVQIQHKLSKLRLTGVYRAKDVKFLNWLAELTAMPWGKRYVHGEPSAASLLNELLFLPSSSDIKVTVAPRLYKDHTIIAENLADAGRSGYACMILFSARKEGVTEYFSGTIYKNRQCCIETAWDMHCLSGAHTPIRMIGFWTEFLWPVAHHKGTAALLKTLPQPIWEEVLEHIREAE